MRFERTTSRLKAASSNPLSYTRWCAWQDSNLRPTDLVRDAGADPTYRNYYSLRILPLNQSLKSPRLLYQTELHAHIFTFLFFRFSHFSHFRFITSYLLSSFSFLILNSSTFPNSWISPTIGTISRQSSDFFQQLLTSSQSRPSALRTYLILPNTFLTTISLSSQSPVSGFAAQSKAILQPVRCYCAFSHLIFTQFLRIFSKHPQKRLFLRKIR